VQGDICEQQTAPLPVVNAFHGYLARYRLLWVDVARASGVPCLTVWSMDHGLLVDPLQALRVRQGVYKLTGVHYLGPLPITTERGGVYEQV
jgi:hypothetical protein